MPAAAGGVDSKPVQAELISEMVSIAPGQPFWVGVRLTMADHWHTYWRNPGDAGLPTTIRWNLPEGFQAGPLEWPYPRRLEVAEMVSSKLVSFGYEQHVLLVAKIDPSKDLKGGNTVILRARADWVQCKDICVKGGEDLTLPLTVSREALKRDERVVKEFEEARAALPLDASAWQIQAGAKAHAIQIRMVPPKDVTGTVSHVWFFPEESGVIEHAAAQTLKHPDTGYVLELVRSPFSDTLPAQLRGVLVSSEGWVGPGSSKALEINVPIESDVSWSR